MKQRVRQPDETRAMQAQEAHYAIVRATAAQPSLRANPFWTLIRQDAYERFAIEFQKLSN